MTLDEFYAELRREIPWRWWYLNRAGEIRCQLGSEEYEYCPITALATQTLGMRYYVHQYDDAVQELDMSEADALDVVIMADNDGLAFADSDYSLLVELGIFV